MSRIFVVVVCLFVGISLESLRTRKRRSDRLLSTTQWWWWIFFGTKHMQRRTKTIQATSFPCSSYRSQVYHVCGCILFKQSLDSLSYALVDMQSPIHFSQFVEFPLHVQFKPQSTRMHVQHRQACAMRSEVLRKYSKWHCWNDNIHDAHNTTYT